MDLSSHDQKRIVIRKLVNHPRIRPQQPNWGGPLSDSVRVYVNAGTLAGGDYIQFAQASPGSSETISDEAMQIISRAAGDDRIEERYPWEVLLLARLIYSAAARQYRIPLAMEGVGSVIINRANSGMSYYPKTIEEVIWQSGQFNEPGSKLWWEAGNPEALRGEAAEAYTRALTVSVDLYGGAIPDPTGGAVAFHSLPQYTHPGSSSWHFIKEIGPFKFFK